MKALASVEKYLLYLVVFLLPLFVLPIFPNPYETPKVALLAIGLSLVILIKAVRTLSQGSLELAKSKFDLPVALLGLTYLASALFITPNKMDAFLSPATATVVVAGVILFYLLGSYGKEAKRALTLTLFFSGVVLALISLLAASGILARLPGLPAYVTNVNFNPLGGQLPLTLLLIPYGLLGVYLVISEKEAAKKFLYGVSFVVLLLALGLTIVSLLPGKATSPRFPSFNDSWNVAVDSLKESPFLGVGPGNYLTAFNRFRPIDYNGTDLWPLRFTTARNYLLTLMTETGLFGLFALGLLTWAAVKASRKLLSGGEKKNTQDIFYLASFGSFFVLSFIFPFGPVLTVVLFILLALYAESSKVTLNLSTLANFELGRSSTRLPAVFIAVPAIVGVLIFNYFALRAFAAEAKFKTALDALSRNDGKATYDLLRASIGLNPYVDRYHATYAQVNLAIARSLAQNENLTDTDRNTIAQLIQQAINEGKATVTLNPQRAGNWELLARTYQAIMPFAEGADTFAIQTFSQAVVLDPLNPNLRIALGGIYYSLGRYDEAIRIFELAVLAKPDLANSRYNLAITLREKGEIEKAITEMTTVLSLVDKDSSDYNLAKSELERLEERRPAAETEGTENLTPPQEAEAPAIEPPLTLPEGSSPPETQNNQ